MLIISRADYILLAAPLIAETLHMIVSGAIGMKKLGEVPI
jgi:phosphoglycerate dehydrogenase-like enzyme